MYLKSQLKINIEAEDIKEERKGNFPLLSTRNTKRLVSTRNKGSTFQKAFNPAILGGEGADEQIEDDGDDFSKRFGDLFTGGRNTGFSSHSGSKTSRKKTVKMFAK